MRNLEKILKQGYFYNIHNEKCHIVHRTDEYIVFKHFSFRVNAYRFEAESMEEFEIKAYTRNLHTAESKKK
ncbi:MAG: hypothetical protein J6W00_14920 [Lentisphaeria bacterium]|nr:hypothetical protein [Lentisphaeria bacterium]